MQPPAHSTLLFLCTGNYYRSRFAETLFNARVTKTGLFWVAESRGLALERGSANTGPISSYAVRSLQARGIVVPATLRYPTQVQEQDLAAAALIIALDETEHRELLQQRFPHWAERVEYWRVHDLHLVPAHEALSLIEAEVTALLARLSTLRPSDRDGRDMHHVRLER